MPKRALIEQLKNLPYLDKVKLSQILGKEGEVLNYWVKKLLAEKTLIPLKKGFYTSSIYLLTLKNNPGEQEKYLEYLANMLRYPSYLSLEYLLAKYGLIPEGVFTLTSITIKSPRIYSNSLATFIYRKIKPALFAYFTQKEFQDKKIFLATPAKALFDFLYFKKFASIAQMRAELILDLRLNWEALRKEDQKELREIIKNSGSKKMLKVLTILKKEAIL